MKTIYLNEKKKIAKRKVKKIAKKLDKINRKEEVVVALSKTLNSNTELIDEIESYKIKVLNRTMAFKIYDK